MFARQGSAIIPEAITHVKQFAKNSSPVRHASKQARYLIFYYFFSVADGRSAN
jgi:hypothetical protein